MQPPSDMPETNTGRSVPNPDTPDCGISLQSILYFE